MLNLIKIYTKKKVVHKTSTTYDKRLYTTLKRIGGNEIPIIEEVNFFKDETLIQFLNPKGTNFRILFNSIILLL